MATAETYSDEVRAEALRLYPEMGPAAVARKLGVPNGTVKAWARRAGITAPGVGRTRVAVESAAAARALQRETFTQDLLDQAAELLRRMNTEHVEPSRGKDGGVVVLPLPPAGAVRDLSVALGIVLDKHLLLSGDATSRHEVRGRDALDEKLRELTAAIAAEAGNPSELS